MISIAPSIFCYSDGGRVQAGFEHEKNDCAVRAYVGFTGCEYAEAHAVFAKVGRKDRRGTSTRSIDGVLKDHHSITGGGTVGKLCKQYPTGKLYVLIRGHAFAVVDGIVHDTFKPGVRQRVRKYWVKNSSDAAPVVPKRVEFTRADVINTINDVIVPMGVSRLVAIKSLAMRFGITDANARYYINKYMPSAC